MNANNKKKLKFILKIALSAVIIVLLLYKSNIAQVISTIKALSVPAVIIILAVNFIALWISAIKWKILLGDQTTGYLFKVVSISNLYSLVLPGQLFGEASKVIHVARTKEGVERAASSVIIDKITGLLGLLIVGFVGLLFTSSSLPAGLSISLILGFCIVFFALFAMRIPVFLKFIENFFVFLSKRFRKAEKAFTKVSGIFTSWGNYSKQKKAMLLSVLWGIIYQLSIVLGSWLICFFLNIHISIFDQLWVNAVLAVALLLPISFGGIGLRDVTLVVLLGQIGVTSEMALSISFILLGVRVASSILGGIFVFYDMYKSKKKIQQEEIRVINQEIINEK